MGKETKSRHAQARAGFSRTKRLPNPVQKHRDDEAGEYTVARHRERPVDELIYVHGYDMILLIHQVSTIGAKRSTNHIQ